MKAQRKLFNSRVSETVYNIVRAFLNFMNGRFGRKTLKEPYRKIWRIVMWSGFVVLVMVFILMPLIEAWSRVVDVLNYIIWG